MKMMSIALVTLLVLLPKADVLAAVVMSLVAVALRRAGGPEFSAESGVLCPATAPAHTVTPGMCRLWTAVVCGAIAIMPNVASAQQLAGYRDFRLGMSPEALSAQVGPSARVRTLHERPALIQEVLWYTARGPGALSENEVVRSVAFTFDAGELYRIVIEYERAPTEGLTGDDVIEALTAQYGQASRPRVPMMGSFSGGSDLGDAVVASWQNTRATVTLIQPMFLASFGLAIVDRRLEELARRAVAEAARLETVEGPSVSAIVRPGWTRSRV